MSVYKNKLREGKYFWTTDEYEEKTAMFRRLYYDEVFVNQWFENMNYGYSIRCVIELEKF